MKNIFTLIFLSLLFVQCEKEVINAVEESTCSTPATVKDLTGLDGCRFVFVLSDGTRLLPLRSNLGWCGTPPLPKEVTEDPLYNFEFVDGKKVFIDYEAVQAATVCMAGKTVKITCLSEAKQTDDR